MALARRPGLRLLPDPSSEASDLEPSPCDANRARLKPARSPREDEERLIAAFLETRGRLVAGDTRAGDRLVLNSHLLPWLREHGLLLWEMTPDDVEQWADGLAASVRRSTIRNYMGHLEAFFAWLVSRRADELRERYAVSFKNPVDRFNRIPRHSEEEDFVPRPDEAVVRTFLAHRVACIENAPSDGRWLLACRDYMLWMVMNWAGLRRAEVVALTRDDIDLAGVPNHHGSSIRIREGKGHKHRVVDIHRAFLKKLVWYLQEVRPQAPGTWTGSSPLFLSQRRNILYPDTLNYLLMRQQAEAGLAEEDWFGCHGFRRAYATRLFLQLRAGRHSDPLTYIQGQLGHVYPSTTVRYCQLPSEYSAALRAEAARTIGRHYSAMHGYKEGHDRDD